MMISMKIDKMKGNITAEGFKDHISLDRVACELAHAGAFCHSECDEDAQPFAEISIVKKVDSSSTALFECAVNQKVLPKVEIALSGVLGISEQLNLKNVVVHFHGFEHEDPEGTGGRTHEFYSFIPESLERVFISYDEKGKPGKPLSYTWEICKPKKTQKAKAATKANAAKTVKKTKKARK